MSDRAVSRCGNEHYGAASTTVEALMYELRTLGLAALSGSNCRQRLSSRKGVGRVLAAEFHLWGIRKIIIRCMCGDTHSRPKASHCQVAVKGERSFTVPQTYSMPSALLTMGWQEMNPLQSTADPKGAVGSLNLDGAVALGCRHKSKRAACRLDSHAAGRFIRVVHELIKPDARFWSDS